MLLKIAGIKLDSGVSFCGHSWIYGRGKLQIAHDTWISPGSIFFTHIEADIVIGSCCDIGPGVKFITGTHEIGPSARRAGLGYAKGITLSDGVWIGARSTILGGCTIGAGSVIAAGSLVRCDIPANCLAAGVPAVIKRRLPS